MRTSFQSMSDTVTITTITTTITTPTGNNNNNNRNRLPTEIDDLLEDVDQHGQHECARISRAGLM